MNDSLLTNREIFEAKSIGYLLGLLDVLQVKKHLHAVESSSFKKLGIDTNNEGVEVIGIVRKMGTHNRPFSHVEGIERLQRIVEAYDGIRGRDIHYQEQAFRSLCADLKRLERNDLKQGGPIDDFNLAGDMISICDLLFEEKKEEAQKEADSTLTRLDAARRGIVPKKYLQTANDYISPVCTVAGTLFSCFYSLKKLFPAYQYVLTIGLDIVVVSLIAFFLVTLLPQGRETIARINEATVKPLYSLLLSVGGAKSSMVKDTGFIGTVIQIVLIPVSLTVLLLYWLFGLLGVKIPLPW